MNSHFNYTFFLLSGMLLSLLFGSSCQSTTGNTTVSSWKDYYYPVNQLKDGLFYTYNSTIEGQSHQYHWFLQHEIRHDSSLLKSTYIEDDGYPRQETEDLITPQGVYQQKLTLHSLDSLNEWWATRAKILNGEVFPFSLSNNKPFFFYHINIVGLPPAKEVTSISKERKYIADTTIVINTRSYDCIRLDVKETIFQGNDEDGYAQPEVYTQEFYAKEVGLVKYSKFINGTKQIEYELVGRQKEL